jgi:hypothetical protein
MAAPNIVNVTTILGKTAVQQVTTSATAIVTNAAASGKVLKVNALYIANVDGTNAADISVGLYRSSASISYEIAHTVSVPADATLDVISKSIYLEEGDDLRLTASANSDLEAVCSYEEIS